jgi:16S rRNA (guanine966-N2)-methyltransferase
MTRIVGGLWRGRRLITPDGRTTRPTSGKVRAALASSLTATGGLEGARVLDLYAGSGALGLELVSRGASSAVFVERDRAALQALRANVETLGAATASIGRPPKTAGVRPITVPTLIVVPGDVAAFVSRSGGGPFDIVVADPPYDIGDDALLEVFADLHRAGVLAPHADLVVERSARAGEPRWPDPLEGVRTRKYGDTLLCYGRGP